MIEPADGRDPTQQLLEYFRNTPEFDFGESAIDLTYKSLTVSDTIAHVRFDLDRQFDFLGQRLRYHDFGDGRGEEQMAWPNEYITEAGTLSTSEPEAEFRRRYVNWSREASLSWFRNLIDKIPSKTVDGVLLFGNPGTGKSTLLKYLIQRTRLESSEKGILFSRFETAKFLEWLPVNTPQNEVFFASLTHYLHALLLRDVIFNEAGTTESDGNFKIRAGAKRFGSVRELEKFVSSALTFPARASQDDELKALQILISVCIDREFELREVLKIPPTVLAYLARSAIGHRKIVFVFDGLDLLQPNDERIESEKYFLFLFLMDQFKIGGPADYPSLKDVIPSLALPIIVMRSQTYQDWVRRKERQGRTPTDVKRPEIELRSVAPPAFDVAVYKLIPRDKAELDIGQYKRRAMLAISRVVDAAEEVIMTRDLRRVPDLDLLAIFEGNLREQFRFVRGLLSWMREDGVLGNADDTLRDFITHLETADLVGKLEQLRYRLFDLLLRFNRPYFQNLTVVTLSKDKQHYRLVRSTEHDGFVDNLFNYSFIAPHAGPTSNHCLILKIRILQFLDAVFLRKEFSDVDVAGTPDARASGAAIIEFLKQFGYSGSSLVHVEEALTLLRYGGFVRERFNFGDAAIDVEFGNRVYSITPKGQFSVRVMIFNTGYLEHCFHRTLLPKKILPSLRNIPREDSILQWSKNSITNYFVVLSYLRYVESNTPDAVLKEYSLYEPMRLAICRSVEHMCRAPQRRTMGSDDQIPQLALAEIKRLLELWAQNDVLAD
jgi:hypothetical protein